MVRMRRYASGTNGYEHVYWVHFGTQTGTNGTHMERKRVRMPMGARL